MNIKTLRLTAPSEFLFNELIIKMYPPVNGSVNLMESCLAATLYFKGIFFVFFKTDQYLLVVLDLLQINSVNHIFTIESKTPLNFP